MESILTYRGKTVTHEDAGFIQALIDRNPNDSRRSLSVKLCRAWNWTQANGALRDMVCRGLMLTLHRAGHIRLPEKKVSPNNPLANRRPPERITVCRHPIEKKLSDITPLEFKQVRRSPAENLFNSLLAQHHYLGYTQPVGEQLKYIVYAQKQPIACLAWSSAARHIGIYRMEPIASQATPSSDGIQQPFSCTALGSRAESCLSYFGPNGSCIAKGLASHIPASHLLS